MPQKLSKISDFNYAEAVQQWLLSNHCVFVGDAPGERTFTDSLHLVSGKSVEGNWLFGIKHLDWDTQHYGIKMGKVLPFITPEASPHIKENIKTAQSLLDDLLSQARQSQYSYLSVLVHPQDSVGQHILARAGFELMDTTVLYSLDLQNRVTYHQAVDKIKIRPAVDADLDQLQKMAVLCFGERNNNINRFNSDPFLDQEKVKDLYRKWMYNSLGGRNMADVVFVAEYQGNIAGFVTLKLDKKNNKAEIPLNAVNPEYKGLGIYKQMIDFALDYLQNKKCRTVEIWTHVTNFAVHKTWQKLGANLKFCAHQYRKYWGD